jgi:ribosomal protein S18 acetylase RimI-like enzyme
MISYRKATIEDIPALIALRIALLKEVMGIEQAPVDISSQLAAYYKQHIPDGSYISWVAVENNTIVSANGIFFYDFPPNFVTTAGQRAYILNVYTLPEYRRQGIAKVLFGRLMEELDARGIKQASLHTSPDGMDMYAGFGFKPKGNEMVWGQHI